MALLFCSGSDDFDDEDFLSAVEGIEQTTTEPGHVSREPTSVFLRPIPKLSTEASGAGKEFRHPKLFPAQQSERSLRSPETQSSSPAVQDVDDEELLSLCSQLEEEVTQNQHQAPEPQLNPTLQTNRRDTNTSSFQLRPSRNNQDVRSRCCLSDITAQSQNPHLHANQPIISGSLLSSGSYQSPEPTAKRPCLRPNVEPQTVTPGRAGTFNSLSNSAYPRPITSPGANLWQTGPANSHPVTRPPLSSPGPHPPSALQTPVVTNHLIQLMTAANKTPRNLPWETAPPKERRFPGPAGLLPQQGGGRKLDEILVSTPHTPSHGAQAKPHSKEGASSQLSVEEQFIQGPWATMKAELLLNENDPSCFLRSYSVVMVLRKAALKQLPRNKVPTMAVALKSLTLSNGDASAVFRDPTGDIQGTVHHLLLEERESELKIGSVLLLQQVGVFSPSYRNHYLNVTPSNLVKIYPPVEEGGTNRVPMSHDEVDLNNAQTSQTWSPLQPSSSAAQTSHPPLSSTSHTEASQPAVSHLISRSPHPAGTHTSFNTTRSRNAQPASSRLSVNTEQPETPQPDWELDDLDSLLGDFPESKHGF